MVTVRYSITVANKMAERWQRDADDIQEWIDSATEMQDADNISDTRYDELQARIDALDTARDAINTALEALADL